MEAQILACDVEPLDSMVSDTVRIAYGNSSSLGSTGINALSARAPWPISRRPGPLDGLPACDNDEKGDVTKPVIDLIEPEEGAVLKIGNGKGVHFEMNLSDDVMLRSYKINIHNNFDHHGHDSRAAGEKNTAFTFDKVYDVSGLKNTKVHHHDIVIPADAAPGDYHLMVWCTDAAGNQTEVARNIVLSADGGTETEHDHE